MVQAPRSARTVFAEACVSRIVDAVSNDGKWIASDDGPTGITILAGDTLAEVCRVKQEHQRTWTAFAPDGKTIATADVTGHIQLWNLPTGSLVGQLATNSGNLVRIWFSKDGRRLAAIANKDSPENDGLDKLSQIQLFVFTAADEP